MVQNITKQVVQALETVESTVQHMGNEVDAMISPVRKSAFARFPTLFLLLVTFGVAATFLGSELLLKQIPYVYDHPWLMLSIGVGVLALTGTLYKKLG